MRTIQKRPAGAAVETQRAAARRLRGATALLAAVLVSGCGLAGPSGTTYAAYESIYPITVESGAELLELTSLNGLPAGEAQRVDGFAATYRQRGEGEITVAYPSDQEAGATVEDVLQRLSLARIPAERIVTGPYSREADGDRGVVLSYFTPVATGSGCPNFWGVTVDDHSNARGLRVGCANRQNLAAMAARPRDLLAPQPMTPADTEARTRAFLAYRAGEDTRSEDRLEASETTD